MATSTLATMRSITMKGRNNKKPIKKASVSSLMVKAGTSTTKSLLLICAACSGFITRCAALRKNSRSFSLACRVRNSRIGSLTVASTCHIDRLAGGAPVSGSSSFIACCPTGYITNQVSTSARPLVTIAGGTCCKPSALRSSANTTTSLV